MPIFYVLLLAKLRKFVIIIPSLGSTAICRQTMEYSYFKFLTLPITLLYLIVVLYVFATIWLKTNSLVVLVLICTFPSFLRKFRPRLVPKNPIERCSMTEPIGLSSARTKWNINFMRAWDQ